MGKVKIITQEQAVLLEEFRKDEFLGDTFYFTGGTALSLYYIRHRTSADLDFFSQEKFDPQIVLTKLTLWQEKFNFSIDYIPFEANHTFNLTFFDKNFVKVDFVFYPYKNLNPPELFGGIKVDSLFDIAVNKLLMIEQRTEIKDFVDLYFLLQKFTIWDLIAGIKPKFNLTIDPLIIASDFLKVEDFDYLPKMIKPLTLEELKLFFTKQAKSLGSKLAE